MIIDEAKKMAEAKLKCMEREVSCLYEDCNKNKCDKCALNYEQGNMGEQIEWLRIAIQALEAQSSNVLQYLEYTYSGAKMMDDLEIMLRTARAIEAYKLDIFKNCRIEEVSE